MNAKTKVLILDDEPIVGERLKTSLEHSGFDVDAFSSSTEALAGLKDRHYDILVTDLKMSSPDGIEVLRTAREIRPGIKAVVITGFATKATAEEAKQSGASAFIAKPFKMKDLKNLLLTMMGTGPEGEE